MRGQSPKHMSDELPSEEELQAGRMADGSAPPLHSVKLEPEWDKPVPGGDENKSPFELTREELHYKVDLNHLRQLDLACEFNEACVQAGLNAMRNKRAEPSPEPEPKPPGRPALTMNGIQSAGSAQVPKNPAKPKLDDAERALLETERHQKALEAAGIDGSSTSSRVATKHDFSALPTDKLLVMAERCSKNLATLSAKRAEVAHAVIDAAMALDTRRSFLQDRAVAVVFATLLHMQDCFRDVGFGSWMPFRYPDQWLSFCGILQRVLAANGLIHSKNADVYRRLLDETPPVEQEGTVHTRIKNSQSPNNIALCERSQGAKNMSELQTRLNKLRDPPI